MIIQFFLYIVGQAYTWLLGWELPDQAWVIMQRGLAGMITLNGYMPRIPYIPYSDVSEAARLFLLIWMAVVVIALIANVINGVVRIKS